MSDQTTIYSIDDQKTSCIKIDLINFIHLLSNRIKFDFN